MKDIARTYEGSEIVRGAVSRIRATIYVAESEGRIIEGVSGKKRSIELLIISHRRRRSMDYSGAC